MPANIGLQLTTRRHEIDLAFSDATEFSYLPVVPAHMPVKQHLCPSSHLLMSMLFWLYHQPEG
jgi:hypothetical protein